MKTFEFALWKIRNGKVEFEFLGIYHPLSLQLHKHTNQWIIDEFLEQFVDLSNRYLNMMIGDFNCHVENKNVDADQFKDRMEAMGLVQHINFATHLRQHYRFIIFRAARTIKN